MLFFFVVVVTLAAVAVAAEAGEKFVREIGMGAGFSNETELSSGSGLCSYSATCTSGGVEGVCVSISAGCCSGTHTAGLCPGMHYRISPDRS